MGLFYHGARKRLHGYIQTNRHTRLYSYIFDALLDPYPLDNTPLFISVLVAQRVLSAKARLSLSGDVLQTCPENQPSGISMTPYKYNLVYERVKIEKKWLILVKIWLKKRQDWYMNGSPFLDKLVRVWVHFHILGGTSLPKPNLRILLLDLLLYVIVDVSQMFHNFLT